MKTRRQIIEEIVRKNEEMPAVHRAANLQYALLGLQDAMLFQLAKDLNISLEAVKPLEVQL